MAPDDQEPLVTDADSGTLWTMDAARGGALPTRVGPYAVVGRLALGGMAELLVGHRIGPSGFTRTVAIKRILPHLSADPDFQNMFLDEARLAAMIQHPNVVRVEDLGHDGESYYMAMEFLEGETLHALLRSQSDKLLDPATVAHIVAECAAGLLAAHQLRDGDGKALNVVHRDVTPQNLFVTYDGGVKVIDFGVAQASQRLTKTQSGVIKGKFAYMSPEQLRDQPVDHRSDQFSLGVVLFEMLTGRRLFSRSSQGATVHAVISETPPLPSELREGVPAELDDICAKALSKNRDDRFASCEEMREALVHVCGSATVIGGIRKSLATQMRATFPDRVDAKRALRTGTTDISAVEIASGPRTQPTFAATKPAASRSKALLVALGLVVAVVIAGVMRPSPQPEPVAAEPSMILLELSSEPPGATILIPGAAAATTPASIELPLSNRQIRVRVEHEGFEAWTQDITLDVSQHLRATLRPHASPVVPSQDPAANETAPAVDVETPSAAAVARREERRRRRRERREAAMEATNAMSAIPIWD